MDISKQFSFTDFLAYLFPGILGTSGIFLLLMFTPLNNSLSRLSIDLSTGILLLVISYILGVIFSGLAGDLILLFRRLRRKKDLRESLYLTVFPNEVLDAFRHTFQLDEKAQIQWSEEHYSMCRSIVAEFMPETDLDARRQNGLRQLRKNLIIPILIWFAVGILEGIRELGGNARDWGITIIIASSILAFLILKTLMDRMRGNEQREIQRVLLGFLLAHKIGLFDLKNRETNIQKRRRTKRAA
jgi:hypothetical protein